MLFLAYQGDKIFELESIPWLSAISILMILSLMPAVSEIFLLSIETDFRIGYLFDWLDGEPN